MLLDYWTIYLPDEWLSGCFMCCKETNMLLAMLVFITVIEEIWMIDQNATIDAKTKNVNSPKHQT